MKIPSDIYSAEKRSEIMSKVRSKNTKPEIFIRSKLHRRGFRFRLHRNDLPGNPDIVFPKHRCVIFIHGCFWHQHPGCKKATIPKSNYEFWLQKLGKNVERDKRNIEKLINKGWKVVIVWECETKKDMDSMITTLEAEILRKENHK